MSKNLPQVIMEGDVIETGHSALVKGTLGLLLEKTHSQEVFGISAKQVAYPRKRIFHKENLVGNCVPNRADFLKSKAQMGGEYSLPAHAMVGYFQLDSSIYVRSTISTPDDTISF